MLAGLERTHRCGELTKENINQEVTLFGWVARCRDHGGVIFIDLRDRSGKVQLVFNPQVHAEAYQKAQTLRAEFVIGVKGKVKERPPEMVNPNLSTGEIEIEVQTLQIFNTTLPLPFPVEGSSNIPEELRLRYRYLDLRRDQMQKTIQFRHRATKVIRDFLDKKEFLEIETPMLIRSTPEGARDYLVATRVAPGYFFALPQSPQLYKQLLMVAGFERYFQIVRCFRDEDLRADRQPEFTQLDIEMSFCSQADIFKLNEELLAYLFSKLLNVELSLPFPKIPYQEALRDYGTDKPDVRFGLLLHEITSLVKASQFEVFKKVLEHNGVVKGINVKKKAPFFSRPEIEKLKGEAEKYGARGLVWFKCADDELSSPVAKFFTPGELLAIREKLSAERGDFLIFVADNENIVNHVLSNLRRYLAEKFKLIKEKFQFVWIVDFPLFKYNSQEKRLESVHHPFTAPNSDDIALLDQEPLKVRALAYDLVLNGVEVAGGSIRLHEPALQKKVFKILGISEKEVNEKFGFFVEAFNYGAPPHGGIAFGFDRLIAVMTGQSSIREVIPFPKGPRGTSLLSKAPFYVSPSQLKEVYIQVKE
jgi:aspartyl-tRNA synthetase